MDTYSVTKAPDLGQGAPGSLGAIPLQLDENNLDRRRPNIRDALQALIGSYMCHMW